MVLLTIDKLAWTPSKGVPISEARKLKWIEQCIEWLKNNPDEPWTSISSGDTYIQVRRDGDYYEVDEYEPRRNVLIERDPDDKDACSCDIITINSKGCQCGGV